MRQGRLRGCAVAACVVACAGGMVLGQTDPPPYPYPGFAEFRWRERSTPGYNGEYTLGPGTVAAVDVMPTPDPTAAEVTTQDATVVLVLEVKVTQTAAGASNPIRGLYAAGFDIVTNQETGGGFARAVVSGSNPGLNPRAHARVSATNLGFSPTTLMGYRSAQRGVVAPFRNIAGELGNGPGVGLLYNNPNRIEKATFGLLGDFEATDPDTGEPLPQTYAEAGLNTWVPIYIAIYNITDVTTPRDIVFTMANSPTAEGSPPITDYNLRTWRGAGPPPPDDLLWKLAPGFTTPPTFTVHVVPGPGATGVLALGCGMALRRRRRGA